MGVEIQIMEVPTISERRNLPNVNDKWQFAARWARIPLRGFALLLVALSIMPDLHARQPADSSASPAATDSAAATPEQRLASLQLEMTNAYSRVLQIVNQRVTAYARNPDTDVSVYSPGWFHAGAIKPDFNTVDVRKSRELPYLQHPYVSSDLNPGICFLGKDLEFNSMIKYFYTNRSLPKHKLTEAEMLEINQLYRVIGRCEGEIAKLQTPARNESQAANAAGETEQVVPGQSFEAIRKIPKEKRILYGGIAIGGLVALMIVMRLFKKPAE